MPEEYKNMLSGGCHCNNIRFELYTDKTENDFIPRTCQCGLCKKHGASWISDPEGSLVIMDTPDVSFYQFGHKTSDFIICPKCGVLTCALCEIDGLLRAVINIKSMPDHKFTAQETLTDFDDETVESRLERRAKNWTGEVIFSGNDISLEDVKGNVQELFPHEKPL